MHRARSLLITGAARSAAVPRAGSPFLRAAASRASSGGAPLGSREMALEKNWANKEDARLIKGLQSKAEASKARSAAAAAAGAAARGAPPPPPLAAEELALQAILPAASKPLRAKLLAWKREAFV